MLVIRGARRDPRPNVGCGHGASTILMAHAYPASTFVGYDYHEGSIAVARRRAAQAGVTDRVSLTPRRRLTIREPKTSWRASTRCTTWEPGRGSPPRTGLAGPNGTWMIVEPRAGDRVEDNLNPGQRLYYAASTMICTPASLAQDGGMALGAQAAPACLEEVIRAAGFTRVTQATETPFNIVLQPRP